MHCRKPGGDASRMLKKMLAIDITLCNSQYMTWLALIMSLPTSPSAVRVRTWRALKAAGCGALRDGVYLLPDNPETGATLAGLAEAIEQGGGEVTILSFAARDPAQQAQFIALFDRSADFKEFVAEVTQTRRAMRTASERTARSEVVALSAKLDALRRTDFFPGPKSAEAETALEALRAEGAARWAPGEPGPAQGAIVSRAVADYRGRTWATRKRPWVDRLASAWLIFRFIDPQARFVWFDPKRKCPKEAIGFDFDGAAFTHVEGKVTFEVLVASFELEQDDAIRRLGDVVHYIDVGGIPSAEAAGLEAMTRGLQAQHSDDDALFAAACVMFDALYAGLKEAE